VTLVFSLSLALGILVIWIGKASSRRPPQAKFPAVVDLGVQEMGSIVSCRIPFENPGHKTLIVNDISTSCSCAGFEIETEAGTRAVRSFSVRSGEVVTVSARVAVRAQGVGSRVSLDVNFRTNDPDKPNGRLQIVVTEVRGGVLAVPDRIGFGEVAIGTQAEQWVDLWDSSKTERRFTLHPAQECSPVSVELFGVDPSRKPVGTIQEGMRFVGQLLIKVDTTKEVEYSGVVALSPIGEDRKPDQVAVFVNVVRPVICTPSPLVLPVGSGPGRRYEGAIMVRAMDGRSITKVDLLHRPEWCECVMPDSWSSSHGAIRVKVSRDRVQARDVGETTSGRLSFAVRIGDDELIADAEVRILP
jgi:hypothetical protein